MATKQVQSFAPTPTHPVILNPIGLETKEDDEDWRIVVIIYGVGQEAIVSVFADVLGKPYRAATSFNTVGNDDHGHVIGIRQEDAKYSIRERDTSLTVTINAHCVNQGMPPNESLSAACDYEFLYTETPFFRRDLSRFIAFTLGQTNHHDALLAKSRTYFISTTFPDVRTALSNLDILTVGSDAVEIRVDLLKEPVSEGQYASIPSLSYVGQQVMLLRQRTELPIIFTTRCSKENGKFPMDDPELYLKYLYRAIQWGCEYVDVEIWLPEEIRRTLYEKRGNSKIISAFHDFSGIFKWSSTRAQEIFNESRRYGDIVKMITIIKAMSENYELEYFRSQIKSNDGPPLSAVNMGQLGQLSRALNTVFSPVTHPLLPVVAAPGQLSAAEINGALTTMGQLPKKDIYSIGSLRSAPQAAFFEKCFNELGLPYNLVSVDRGIRGSVEAFCMQPGFGGAFLEPPLSNFPSFIPVVSNAARIIGSIDTIVVRNEGSSAIFAGENATWKGIRATLTRDFAPSAYGKRAAIVLSSSSSEASSAIFALRCLKVGKIYTVGFKMHGSLSSLIEPFTTIESVQRVDQPLVLISALSSEKSHLVQPLLRHFGHDKSQGGVDDTDRVRREKIFLDLANGPRKSDPRATAEKSGWTSYGFADTSAFTTVETLRLLVGQNVPYNFVRLASGRGLY